jgi:hypothetical protein
LSREDEEDEEDEEEEETEEDKKEGKDMDEADAEEPEDELDRKGTHSFGLCRREDSSASFNLFARSVSPSIPIRSITSVTRSSS